MNKLPIFGGVFELVGLGVTSWFAYRYLFNAADRCVFGQKGLVCVSSAKSLSTKSAALQRPEQWQWHDCRQELKGEIDDFFKVDTAATSSHMINLYTAGYFAHEFSA